MTRRQAKPKADKPAKTRVVASPRRKKIEVRIQPRDEAYGIIASVYREMMTRIKAGYGTYGAKEQLEEVRRYAQALADAYPDLWEKACSEEGK